MTRTEARRRNHKILRLRGIAAQVELFPQPFQSVLIACVDAALRTLGAQTHTERRLQWESWCAAGCYDGTMPRWLK